MYAHATVNHQPLPELSETGDGTGRGKVYGDPEKGTVHVHLPDLYLSFPADEAEALGLWLVRASVDARRPTVKPVPEWVKSQQDLNPDSAHLGTDGYEFVK